MSLSERASFGELFLEVISGREVTLRVCAGANDCGFDNAELCVEACVVSSSSCRLSVLDWLMHRVRMTALVVSQAAPHPFASEFSAAMVFLMRVWRALVEVGVVKDGFVDGC